MSDLPLAEFDPDRRAMIEPSSHFESGRRERPDMPAAGVACFFGDVVGRVAAEHQARHVTHLTAEHGKHDIWESSTTAHALAFFQPGLGARCRSGFSRR